jgi:hypothetical protein
MLFFMFSSHTSTFSTFSTFKKGGAKSLEKVVLELHGFGSTFLKGGKG